jgi:transposase
MIQNPGYIFMQDNAPAHRARTTITNLQLCEIRIMGWPLYSLDLNPIEHIWQWMKDWIARFYLEKMGMEQLREALYSAWDAVPEDFIESLIMSM